MASRLFLLLFLIGVAGFPARAEERLARLYAPQILVETGLLRFILPRFALKTQVKVELVADPAQADLLLGDEGRALFEGAGRVWRLSLGDEAGEGAKRLESWLNSDIGKRTVLAFEHDGAPVFTMASEAPREPVALSFDGNAADGRAVSRLKCARCHAVDDSTRWAGIGSTPSFSVLRSLPDWKERFTAFYALNPHPAFTVVEDVTPGLPLERPPPIVPVNVTLEEIENILAYVAALEPADLGAPLKHQ